MHAAAYVLDSLASGCIAFGAWGCVQCLTWGRVEPFGGMVYMLLCRRVLPVSVGDEASSFDGEECWRSGSGFLNRFHGVI